MPVQTLGPITPFGDSGSTSFVHSVPERRPLPGDMGVSGGEIKISAQRMAGRGP